MSGPKVWEETWLTHGDTSLCVDGEGSGNPFAELRADSLDRAKLASQAPAMARLLLELQRVYMGSNIGTACPVCECDNLGAMVVNGHYDDCRLLTILKAAGVLP